MREITLLWLVVYRLIEVKELAYYGAVVQMFGYGAETVILGNAADVVLAIVLAQGLVVPRDAFLHTLRSVSAAPQSCRALSPLG